MRARSTRRSLARIPQESKGFLGICSIPCSRGHTPSLSGEIAIEPDARGACRWPSRSEQRGDHIRLIMSNFEHDPAIYYNVPHSRYQTMEET